MKQKKLKLILNQIFQKHNFSKDHSKIISNYLIKAELLGAPSHGLARLKMYCDRIKKKLIKARPKIKIRKISNSISCRR